MEKPSGLALVCIWIIFAVNLIFLPGFVQGSSRVLEDLIGCVYESDGITPVEQATVQIKRLPRGEIFTSSLSDQQGMFTLKDIDKGVYILGVKTPRGNFNAQRLLGIVLPDGSPAEMVVVLSPAKNSDKKADFLPLLPNPVGLASISAGNSGVFFGIAVINDRPRETGPFRIRTPQP